VVKVTQLDYTFERQIILEREEGRIEGRAEGHAEGLAVGRAEGRTEGLAEGHADGLAEGIAQGISQSIISILEEKHKIPDELSTMIKNEKDTDILNMWLKAAASASSVSDFMEKCNLKHGLQ